MILRRDSQLVVERVTPNLLHVVPVCDDAVFNGIRDVENAASDPRLFADVDVRRHRARCGTLKRVRLEYNALATRAR